MSSDDVIWLVYSFYAYHMLLGLLIALALLTCFAFIKQNMEDNPKNSSIPEPASKNVTFSYGNHD